MSVGQPASRALHPTRRAVEDLRSGRMLAHETPEWRELCANDSIPVIHEEERESALERLQEGAQPHNCAYDQYLRTERWREFRLAVLARQPVCALCPADASHVHHRTYRHVGWEADEDVVALCERCHDALHLGLRAQKALKQAHR